MFSKTTMKSRLRKKTNPELVETLSLAIKHKPWHETAKYLAGSTRSQSKINLQEIDDKTKAGDTVIIPGKILSKGNLTKKLKLCALSISEKARAKLKESKSDFLTIKEEIQKNTKAEGIKILR